MSEVSRSIKWQELGEGRDELQDVMRRVFKRPVTLEERIHEVNLMKELERQAEIEVQKQNTPFDALSLVDELTGTI